MTAQDPYGGSPTPQSNSTVFPKDGSTRISLRSRFATVLFAGVSVLAVSISSAQLATKKGLTLELAKRIAAASEKEAASHQWHAFVAIMDDGGN
jgi:hypothetical protein